MEQKDYTVFYEKISAPFRGNRAAFLILRFLNLFLTGLMYVLYPALLVYLLMNGDPLFWKCLYVPGISFIIVTLLRAKLDAPRPYALFPISPLLKKDKQGESMPSRHIFSSAVIAMAYVKVMPQFGIFLLVCTAAEALIRVIAGVHFPKDTAVGFLIGVLAGLLI